MMLGVVNISSFFKYYLVTNHVKDIVLLKDQVLIAVQPNLRSQRFCYLQKFRLSDSL